MKIVRLDEDRTVKFGGESFPDFGWCTIMCGGPASGKSTVYDNRISINAKKYDVDAVKKLFSDGATVDAENHTITPRYNKDIHLDMYDVEGDESQYNVGNSKFTNRLHYATKPWTKAKKNSMLHIGDYHDASKLPNIAFDMTGDDINDLVEIVNSAVNYGYKVSIVFVCTDIEVAYNQNQKRARKVTDTTFYTKHRGVLDTLMTMANSKPLLRLITDFWVVVQHPVVGNIHDNISPDKPYNKRWHGSEYKEHPWYKMIKDDNIYNIKCGEDVIEMSKEVRDMIDENNRKLDIAYANRDNWDK